VGNNIIFEACTSRASRSRSLRPRPRSNPAFRFGGPLDDNPRIPLSPSRCFEPIAAIRLGSQLGFRHNQPLPIAALSETRSAMAHRRPGRDSAEQALSAVEVVARDAGPSLQLNLVGFFSSERELPAPYLVLPPGSVLGRRAAGARFARSARLNFEARLARRNFISGFNGRRWLDARCQFKKARNLFRAAIRKEFLAVTRNDDDSPSRGGRLLLSLASPAAISLSALPLEYPTFEERKGGLHRSN
jgi:hypothetical protein